MKTQSLMPNEPEALRRRLRFFMLGLVCLGLFSNYYVFDQPALLKIDIINRFSPIYGAEATNFYFSFLYSFYSIPNIVLPLVGGSLCDKFGYRKTSILCMVFVFFGQLTVYLGSQLDTLKLMVFGRFCLGLGAEALGIAANIFIIKWFTGKELSFANALNLSLCRSATVLNTLLSPKIAEKDGMSMAFGFGAIVAFCSLGALLLLNYLDLMVERKMQNDVINESEQIFDLNEVIKQTHADVQSFPKFFWLLTAIMTTFYITVLIFVSFSQSVFTELWLPIDNDVEKNEELAGDLMSIPFLCCTILSPLIGLFVDKYGERITLMMMSCFLVFFGLLSIMFFYPIYGMLQLGIGYAFFGSTIWTSITFVVPEDKLGTAYGVMNSIQNFAFFLVPLFIAIISSGASQITVVFFFLILACISLILAIQLFKEDYKRDISLNEANQTALMTLLKRETVEAKYPEEDEETDQIIQSD